MKIGKPIEPMLVSESGSSDEKFAKIVKSHKGKTFAEVKYDGYRVQVHKLSGLWLFTRNLNPLNPEVFPDISQNLAKLPNGIYDGELVGYGKSLEEFNSVKKRVRDTLDPELVKQYPIQIKFFDIMQLENKEQLNRPLVERRKLLENYVQNVSEQQVINSGEELKEKFDQVASKGLEGLVCKNPSSLYIPGARNKDWVKLKNFLSLDLAILGVYKGEGKAASLPFAAILVGTSNNGNYETLAKVGISNRDMIEKLYSKMKPYLGSRVPSNLVLSAALDKKTYERKIPDSYIQPEKSAVVEIECLNVTRSNNWHSCGYKDNQAYSLRIASVKGIREDKLVKDIATTKQIEEIYTN